MSKASVILSLPISCSVLLVSPRKSYWSNSVPRLTNDGTENRVWRRGHGPGNIVGIAANNECFDETCR